MRETVANSPEESIWPLSEKNRAYLEDQVLRLSSKETPEIAGANPDEVKLLMDRAVNLVTKLEDVAAQRPRKIHSDTDIVWILSAPGAYSSSYKEPQGKAKPEDKHKAQYRLYPWVKEMYRHRVRTGIALVQEITARRLGKPVQNVTKEDIRSHGPWIVYNPQVEEEEQIKEVLANPTHKIPSEKVFVFSDVVRPDGTSFPIYSTVDQVRGLRFPIHPRRVALVSHAPHLARILFTLDYFNDRIPEGTSLQVFPLKTPRGGELKYPEMEIRAILAYFYKYRFCGEKPVKFEV